MISDIIYGPDGKKGRLISAECHIENKVTSMSSIKAEEQMLAKIWPDWPARIMEFINLRVGPCTDPSVLYQIELGRIVESALLWAGVKNVDHVMLSKVCQFMSAKLGINPERGNQPHVINPREICKCSLLWILAECGKNARGFTRDSLQYNSRAALN